MPAKPDERKPENLLSPERQEELDPFRVLAFVPVEPYQQVADIGCGPGFFAIPLAKYLIYGKLYAVDTSQDMLDKLSQRVIETRLGNVELLRSTENEFPIPDNSLDGILLAFVLHETNDREAFLKAAGKLLKPGGWCAVLEWHKRKMPKGPAISERLSRNDMEALVDKVDLQPRDWRDLNDKHYMMLLRK